MAFHEAICRLSGNTRLHSVFQQHAPALRTLLKVDEMVYSSEEIAEQHRPILDAIAAGDAEAARAQCEAHCQQASETIATYIDQLGEG
jgi:DNA-binding FadR family transcriptional regulator